MNKMLDLFIISKKRTNEPAFGIRIHLLFGLSRLLPTSVFLSLPLCVRLLFSLTLSLSLSLSLNIYIYIYICVCVCVCVCRTGCDLSGI